MRFVFKVVIFTVFTAMLITACSNPFLHEDSIPKAPEGKEFTATSNTITINWSPVSGATEYFIYRSSTASGTYTQVGSSKTPSYTDTGLSAGTTYYYKVAANNNAGEGSQSLTISAITCPGVPTGVTRTITSSGITISWSSVTGATGYYVYRSSPSSDGPYTKVGSPTTTSYTDASLSAGTTYYYKVAAYNSAGTGSQSSSVSATTIPNAPTGVTFNTSVAKTITISWSSTTGATGYYVYRSSTFSGTFTQIGNPTTTSYTDAGLLTGTTYYYKVAAYNSVGTGPQSSAYSATTTTTGSSLTAPAGLLTTGSTYNTIDISWNSVSGATGYYVYRSSTSSGTYTQVAQVTGSTTTTYTNTGLSGGSTYYYKVAAYNGEGAGPQSSYIVAATQYSSSLTITISGTPRVGQTLTAVTTGTGWTGDFIWGYADSADANRYTYFQSNMSGTNSCNLTIPSGYAGKYIRAFRMHPNGTWNSVDTSGNVIPNTKNFPSNYLGPVQQ